MGDIRIQAVCGFGCGSSLFLRMKIEDILKDAGITGKVFTGDVGTCLTQDCDVIFISEELYDRIKDRAKIPVVPIQNFMNKNEVLTKVLEFLETQK